MRHCLGCFKQIKDELEVCPFCGYVKGTPPDEAVHMEPGTILAERYIIGKVIGYGGFGVTYVGWDGKLEQKVAIKEYLPSEFSTRMPGQSTITVFNGNKSEQFLSGLNKFVDEAKRLSKFQKEEGIVRIFDCIAENDTAYIIMEYLEGESLSDRLKREGVIPESEAVNILMPVMKSLEVVHQEGIIHRDIAPDNIFLTTDGHVKLIDFGAARFATTAHSRSLTVIIKPGYSAEEQYRSRSDQGPHTDVYSVAATLYKMITGVTPPDALERRAKIENAKKDILTEPHKINKEISLVTENAILNALNIRIEDRTPTIQQFIDDLNSVDPVKRVYGNIKKIDFYRMPLWLKILAPTLLGVFLVFGVLLATGVISFSSLFKTKVEVPEGYTIVPTIEGFSIDDAINQLAESELNYTTGGSVTSDYIAANLIVYQDPEGGRIIPVNSLVAITVSRGTGVVEEASDGISTVPIFIWSEEAVAISDFETAGLVTSVEYVYDDNVAAGQVISATDEDGNEVVSGMQLPEGTRVILYVSKGPEGFSMPNVVGMSEANARSVLTNSGLVAVVSRVQDTSVASGTVMTQSIAEGTNVTLGTQVTITVATATVITETPVPTSEATSTVISTDNAVVVVTNMPTDSPAGPTRAPDVTVTPTPSITPTPVPTSGPTSSPTSTPVPTNTPTPVPTSTLIPTDIPTPTPTVAPVYTVTFDSNGGSTVSSRTYTSGDALGSLPSPTRSNYTFNGWSSGGSSVSSSTVVTSNMTLVAQWSRDQYTVTFDSNGGSSVSSRTVNAGDSIGSLPTPDREHYNFDGWISGGSGVSSNTVVNSNMTLTAQWTPVSYTITFDSAGGSSVPSMTCNYGQSIGSLPNTSRTYYTFNGWTSGGTPVNSSTVVSSDMTLTANWTINDWGPWQESSSNPGPSTEYMEVDPNVIHTFSFVSWRYRDADYDMHFLDSDPGGSDEHWISTTQDNLYDCPSYGPGATWYSNDVERWCNNEAGQTGYWYCNMLVFITSDSTTYHYRTRVE